MQFIKKPYLQMPKTDGITIMWETETVSDSKVNVWNAEIPNIPAQVYYSIYLQQGEPRIITGEPGIYHRIDISGLRENTDYCYQVVSSDGETEISSDVLVFRTAPLEGTAFSFVLSAETGSAGQPECIPLLVEQMIQAHPDLLLLLGDMVWDGNVAEEWNEYYFNPFAKLIENTPFYHCVGNHERHTLLMDNLFAFSRYYSFDYSDVHFIALDSTLWAERTFLTDNSSKMAPFDTFNVNDEQYRFLEDDLKKCKARWKIVFFHYPPYASAIFETVAMRKLTVLFDKYNVDIVFNAHTVHYERSHPLKNNVPTPSGTRYIVVGGCGAFPEWLRHKTNPETARIIPKPHFVHVAITSFSLELQAIDTNGAIIDMCVIYK